MTPEKTQARTTEVMDSGSGAAAPTPNVPRVGRYELLSHKGEGGQSDVYLAKDTVLGRLVAIKFLLKPDREAEIRMEREAHILASLQHPAICSIFDIGKDAARGWYLVLELLEGKTLREVLENGSVGVDRALAVIQELALALQAAHEKNVVHRDLKPDNVALLPDGSLKLFDFGIARVATSKITEGFRIGTPGYMSPEQHRGDPVDARSDVFSLGCMLYEMLTGKLPFERVSDLYNGRFAPLPAEIARQIADAALLLVRMLSTEPSQRPTAATVAQELTSARRAVHLQDRLDRSAYTEAVTRLLEAIPPHDAEPLPLATLAARSAIEIENAVMAMLQMPLTFGALDCSVDDASGSLLVRAKSEVATFFLASLAIYVRYGLNLIERWERRADSSAGDALCLLGPDFVHAMERRRVFQYGLPHPIRTEHPCQVVIKAFSASRQTAVYLMQYDKFAQQYQLIGGKRRSGESAIDAMTRAIHTKLAGNDLHAGVHYHLTLVRDEVITRALSQTVGAFTEYHFSIFSVAFTKPLILAEEDRWVTEAEMFSGRLADAPQGKWNYELARVVNLLERSLTELPLSLPEPVP